jgi:nucleoside diphosphate kinase
MSERSIFFVRPELADFEEQAIAILGDWGLKVVGTNRMVLDETVIRTLYSPLFGIGSDALPVPGDAQLVLETALRDLEGKVVQVHLVEGMHAVEVLKDCCGHGADPKNCAPGTFRHMCLGKEHVRCGRLTYWRNGAYRSGSGDTAIRDIKLFFPEPES